MQRRVLRDGASAGGPAVGRGRHGRAARWTIACGGPVAGSVVLVGALAWALSPSASGAVGHLAVPPWPVGVAAGVIEPPSRGAPTQRHALRGALPTRLGGPPASAPLPVERSSPPPPAPDPAPGEAEPRVGMRTWQRGGAMRRVVERLDALRGVDARSARSSVPEGAQPRPGFRPRFPRTLARAGRRGTEGGSGGVPTPAPRSPSADVPAVGDDPGALPAGSEGDGDDPNPPPGEAAEGGEDGSAPPSESAEQRGDGGAPPSGSADESGDGGAPSDDREPAAGGGAPGVSGAPHSSVGVHQERSSHQGSTAPEQVVVARCPMKSSA
jgi:hypothetical protein